MKRVFVILLSMVMLVSLLSACGSKADKADIKWSDFELGDKLPALEKVRGEVTVDSKSLLSARIDDITKAQFRSYRDSCIEKGYTIDSEESEDVYDAFNGEGYQLRLVYSDYDGEELSIHLTAPEEMKEFTWPTSGPGALLPATESKKGNISQDSSNVFSIHVGDTPIDAYKAYVAVCEEKGFNIDHSKSEKYYKARNNDGYTIDLRYLGFNKIGIYISAPQEGEASSNNNANTNNDTNAGIGTEFKTAMDSYENFMNEYVAFMKQYKANPTDMSLLSAYTDYMSRYTTFVNDFAKWEGQTMNTAETAYYLEVQNRVAQKLLEVA